MNLKSLVVAVVILVALSGGAYLLNRPAPPPAADARLQQSLVAANLIEQAARLRLTDAGKTVELARQADGTWQVPSYHEMAADFSKLSGFVGNLTEAKLQRLVTSNPERIARLEFKDSKIELLGADGKATFTITLGKNPETGGGRFVRFGEENKAYLASLNAWIDSESRNWANPELISLKLDDLARVEIPFAEGGPIVISRAKKEDAWTADRTPTGQRVKADKIGSLLSTLATVRFTESTATDDANATAAKANQRTFKVTTFDHKTVTVALGRKPEEKKLKAPTPGADGKSGPAALGSVADLTRKDEAKAGEPKKDEKPLTPEFETIPAGPVFAHIAHSEGSQPINALMQKRAFQIAEYSFTSLPQKAEEMFEPIPPSPPPQPPAPAPAPEAPKKN
jgi:hypothetical protein